METIAFTLNGKPIRLETDGERSLLWVLRTDLALTGTKYGCGGGHCGACVALVNKAALRTCLLKIKEVNHKEVTTIEGIAKGDELHPVQKAFMEHDALQCGYCTPGMILTAIDLLARHPEPTEEQIVGDMENNLCRCGAHPRIIKAIQTAAKEMRP